MKNRWIVLFSLLFFACTKHPELATQSTYTFHNDCGQPVTFDVYATDSDYYQNKNRLERHSLNAGDDLKFLWEVGRSYWVDVYNADYTFSNWMNSSSQATPAPKVTVAALDYHYPITIDNYDILRPVILDSGFTSVWKVDVNQSDPSLNGTHTFRFNKDLTGLHEHVDSSGHHDLQFFTYRLANTLTGYNGNETGFSLTLTQLREADTWSVSCDLGPSPDHTGKDTLLVWFSQFRALGQFPAVRQ